MLPNLYLVTTERSPSVFVSTIHFTSRAQKSYLNEVAELALSGVVPRRRRCWLGVFVGRGA